MKRIISVFLILCVLFVAACSNNEPPQPEIVQAPNDYSDTVQDEPEEVEKMRPLRPITIEGTLPSGIAYADLEPFVNEFFRENEHLLAAFSVSVFVDDYVILDNHFGFVGGTAPDFEILNSPDAVFHWAGATKSLVYVSAMQLYERGLLDLNADIRNYLPDDMITIHADSDPVTMLHLMNQTSGLMTDRTVDSGQSLWSDETADYFDLGNYLMSLGLYQSFFGTGEVWMPNYIATALAGYVVETISGASFYEYVNANIFEPLGMTHTSLSPGLADNPIVRAQWEKNRLIRFWMDGSMTLHVGEPLTAFEREMFSIFPAVGAYGTISDLQRFVKALLPDENGYSPLFEHSETLAKMFSVSHEPPGSMGLPRVIRHGFTDENPALGWTAPDETLQIGYGGVGPFGFTYFIADIDNGIGLVFMSNVDISGVFTPGQALFFSEVVKLVFGE